MSKTKDPVLEQRRRNQVMVAVQRLMSESSYGAMTMDRVAKAAGVSKGLINYYFPSKEELVVASIRAYHAAEGQRLALIFEDTTLSAPQRLERLVAAVFPDREAVEREVRFQIEVRAFAKTNPDVWRAIGDSYRGFRVACEAIMRRGRDDGYVTRATAPQEIRWVYLFFHSLVNGLAFQVALDTELSIDELRARLVAHIERMVTG